MGPQTPHLEIEAATLAGGEINQDRYIIGPNFAAVLDGATTFGADPGEHDGGWYAEQLATRLERLLTDHPDDDTADLVAKAIADIRDTFQLAPETSPTSTLALVRWNTETIECYVLGDSTIALIHTDGTETIVTDDRIKLFGTELRDKYRADLRAGGGFGEQHRATLAALQAEQAKHRNVVGGYWIAGAEPLAASTAIVRELQLRTISRIELRTDGVPLDRSLPANVRQIETDISGSSIITFVDRAECSDSRGERWPRSKIHDDKTIVAIEISI